MGNNRGGAGSIYTEQKSTCVVKWLVMRTLQMSERSSYSMSALILVQNRDLRMGVNMRKYRRFDHSTCNRVLNLLKAIYLRFQKIVVGLHY